MMLLFKKYLEGGAVTLPSSMSLSLCWNAGSLLGLVLGLQLITGLAVSCHYLNSAADAFFSVTRLSSDVPFGWAFRAAHANGASLFFVAAFFHVGRGLYYKSFLLTHTWLTGVALLVLLMAAAFMGYVLPWGQMSFWGATVILSMFSAIPWVGGAVVQCIWGDYSVSGVTLNRLYSAHFLVPFAMAAIALVHLIFLHLSTSSNPLGSGTFSGKLLFHPWFSSKDSMGVLVVGFLFLAFTTSAPNLLGDPENFLSADPLVTPVHIKPEWYYLFAYAILRSIPNKLGGVAAMVFSFGFLVLLVLKTGHPFIRISRFLGASAQLCWALVFTFLCLTWLGGQLAEEPYIKAALFSTALYFLVGVLM